MIEWESRCRIKYNQKTPPLLRTREVEDPIVSIGSPNLGELAPLAWMAQIWTGPKLWIGLLRARHKTKFTKNKSISIESKNAKMQKRNCCASSVNRTRASSMATTNSTTRPMMLVDVIGPTIMQHIPKITIPPFLLEQKQFSNLPSWKTYNFDILFGKSIINGDRTLFGCFKEQFDDQKRYLCIALPIKQTAQTIYISGGWVSHYAYE